MWGYCLYKGVIATGFSCLGNVLKLNKERLKEHYKKYYIKGFNENKFESLWNFLHEIKAGDIVLARRGSRAIIGKGKVNGGPFYNHKLARKIIPDKNELCFPNFLPVDWQEIRDVRISENIRIQQQDGFMKEICKGDFDSIYH